MTAGATEAIAAAVTGPGRPRRRGRAVRAVLRLLRRLRRAGRRDRVASSRSNATATGWGFDPAALEARCHRRRPRCSLLNTPHNPTGTVFEPGRAGRGRRDRDPARPRSSSPTRSTSTSSSTAHAHVPIATLPGMRERTVTISSAGKTFSVTGWKIGWACAPPRAARRRAHGEAVPDLRQRRAVPAGRRRGRWPRAEHLAPRAGPAGAARPALRRAGRLWVWT